MADAANDGTFAPLAMVQEVKKAREGELLRLPNVVGLGVGYKQVGGARTDELAVIVYVERKAAAQSLRNAERAPGVLDAPAEARVVPRGPQEEARTLSLPNIRVPTDVQEVGRVEAQTFVDRVRPIKPGYSISHFEVTAGDLWLPRAGHRAAARHLHPVEQPRARQLQRGRARRRGISARTL